MNWLTSPWLRNGWAGFSIYLILGWLSLRLGHHDFTRFALPAMSAAGVIGWWLTYRRYRLVADIPTSRLGSAALGRVELYGTARCHDSAPIYSPLTGKRCVWYRCWRYRNDSRSQLDPTDLALSREMQSEVSEWSFRLIDGKHEVIVQPDGAEVQAPHRESQRDGNDTLVEEWIAEGDPLYVTGQLESSAGPIPDASQFRRDVGQKLAEWKADPDWLKRRFDLDGNGSIDEQEWLAARAAAEREVRQTYKELAEAPPTLLMRRPDDGRPYLIDTRSPRDTARWYRLRAWLHAAAGAIAFIAWLKLGVS